MVSSPVRPRSARRGRFCEVHCLDVMAASVACLDPNVVELTCRVDRELLNRFLTARGAYNSPVCPLRRAHRANQRTLCPIAFGPQYTHNRFSGAKGTDRQSLLARNVTIVISQVLCLRLQKNPRQEDFGLSRTGLKIRGSSPKGGEQILPSFGPLCVQIAGRFSNELGRARLDGGKEPGELGQHQTDVAAGSLAIRIKLLLEHGHPFVELQRFGRKRMCRCQCVGTMDALIPLRSIHFCPAVPFVTCSYQRRWCVLAQADATSPRIIDVKLPRTMAVPM